MARLASVDEIYAAHAATADSESDSVYNPLEDRLHQAEAAFHLRRVRSDHSRSSAARHVAIERHNERRAKQFNRSIQ